MDSLWTILQAGVICSFDWIYHTVYEHPWTQTMALRLLWSVSGILVVVEEWVFRIFPPPLPPATTWTSVLTMDAAFHFSEVLFHDDPHDVVLHDAADLYDAVFMKKMNPLSSFIGVHLSWPGTYETPVPTKMRFLAITYRHPNGAAIPLDVPSDVMMVGNEILSPAFVRWLLQKTATTSSSILFDDGYWLECIDDRIAFLKVEAKQHLVLTEESFVLCTRE